MKPKETESGVAATLPLTDEPRRASSDQAGEANPPVQIDELLERCMGNVHLATRLIKKCQECFDKELPELQASATADADEVARVAHRLKGAAASLSANELCDVFSKIEEHGRSRDLTQMPQYLDQLQTEWTRFVSYTNAYLEEVGS